MSEERKIELLELVTDSLSLQGNISSPARMMSSQTFEDPLLKVFKQDPYKFLGIKNFEKQEDVPEYVMGTPIQEFFRGVNVFVTGATGFFGKVLTQKLIRSIPHISHVYLLIRPKRGNTVRERFNTTLEDKLFDRMRAEVPHYLSKITAIAGDLSEPKLGISEEDRLLLTSRVNVVFHSAADVRFIEPLKSSITSNVIGSQRVLELAKEMKNLKSFVHVSTAYSQCVFRKIPELVPQLPISYKDIIDVVESITEEEIIRDQDKIMQGWPNTYTFTKAVCEALVQEEGRDLPICIFRPAVVGCTLSEPVRGWTDNLYGPLGMFVGSALGVLHCFKLNEELTLDFVPVDYVINGMIAAAWANHITTGRDSILVYNFTLPESVKRNWKVMINCGMDYRDVFPFYTAIYYTTFIRTNNYYVDAMCHLCLHTIPGKVIDRVLAMCGQKPRLSKLYERIGSLKGALRAFSDKIWEFDSDNVLSLWDSMSDQDKDIFNFDMKDLDLREFFFVCKLGIRYFYFKESMETLAVSQRKNVLLKYAHYTVKVASAVLALKAMAILAHILPV